MSTLCDYVCSGLGPVISFSREVSCDLVFERSVACANFFPQVGVFGALQKRILIIPANMISVNSFPIVVTKPDDDYIAPTTDYNIVFVVLYHYIRRFPSNPLHINVVEVQEIMVLSSPPSLKTKAGKNADLASPNDVDASKGSSVVSSSSVKKRGSGRPEKR